VRAGPKGNSGQSKKWKQDGASCAGFSESFFEFATKLERGDSVSYSLVDLIGIEPMTSSTP
jgi:hypothetical protein